MGYYTEFKGRFTLDKPLTEAHRTYLKRFRYVRHMKRDVVILMDVPDPVREAVGLPLGLEGEFFIGDEVPREEDVEPFSIVGENEPPEDLPGLWCGWTPDAAGLYIEWDKVEKFYGYIEWLAYLIDNFLLPWGYELNGKVSWEGEEEADRGVIIVENNKIDIRGSMRH